jgi:enoyl-CoA hydratase/carnithine racemase
LYNSTKATLAAIDGFCIGGGISVAVSCDLRIATAKSKFGQPAMRYGIGYRYKSLRRVADLIGPAATKDLLIGGYMFDAQEACLKGLVGRVLPEESFMEAIGEQARKIAEGAPLTLKQVKQAIAQIVKDPADRDLEEAERLFQQCYASRDYREGIRAFAEKRKPHFVGA